jgi:beta-lactamase regulating signal transducer with metallopeptidase domain
MEQVFLYFIKSSGLIAVFYLAYYFLLRKETFFNSNRWFLLGGLMTSLLLPLWYFKKIILVESPKISMEDLMAYSQATSKTIQDVPVVEAFDWLQCIWVSYAIIVCALVIKILFNLFSLFRMLYQQQVVKKESFKLINLNKNIAPFSFFNYIVFNANLYTQEELQSILLHEKIHSREKHSLDVLIAKFFCIIFWFNPFVWLYKKAIIQNLEFIADYKAIKQLENKKSYQHTLLKVVSHQYNLSITNNFYQSLIKKRIVMLNTNQSQKKNVIKYAFILPILVGFIFLFQIKTIAQEHKSVIKSSIETHEGADITFDAKESDESLKTFKNVFKEEKIITEVSKIKRNSSGEITGICIKMKCEDGRKKELKINQSTPIDKIFIYTNRLENGEFDFGVKHITDDEVIAIRNMVDRKRHGIYTANNNEVVYAVNVDDSLDLTGNFDFNFDFDMEAPEAPEIAEVPDASEVVEINDKISKVIVRKNGDKTLVIINGRMITDDKTIQETLKKLYINDNSSSTDGDRNEIIINGQDMAKIRSEALSNARDQIKKMRPQIKKQIKIANGDWKKIKEEKDNARREQEQAKPDIEKERAEMIKAKEEMIKAKEEMIRAKAELEKEKANLKKTK